MQEAFDIVQIVRLEACRVTCVRVCGVTGGGAVASAADGGVTGRHGDA